SLRGRPLDRPTHTVRHGLTWGKGAPRPGRPCDPYVRIALADILNRHADPWTGTPSGGRGRLRADRRSVHGSGDRPADVRGAGRTESDPRPDPFRARGRRPGRTRSAEPVPGPLV